MKFLKYEATANDFILIDIRQELFTPSIEKITHLCHRRKGIGADGVLLWDTADHADFQLSYYNSDGTQDYCANGTRAAVHYAKQQGVLTTHSFLIHHQTMQGYCQDNWAEVTLPAVDAGHIQKVHKGYYVEVGCPHYVQEVEDLSGYPVYEQGKILRHRTDIFPRGVNVNFVSRQEDNILHVRTYEKGVEEETFSCGTGVVASAVVLDMQQKKVGVVRTLGGDMQVKIQKVNNQYSCRLAGEVSCVYEGMC